MLLGTMLTFVLAFIVPITIGIDPAVLAVIFAPSPSLYWLMLFVKRICSFSSLLRLSRKVLSQDSLQTVLLAPLSRTAAFRDSSTRERNDDEC